ncbi:MAG TPA: glycoside hydrolase family 88 protein, partial [Tepidisphaeraceae bacterium]|nr:glycoside hydrolase family 88 protein [Tepidisphaeraceae bacterium]
KAADWQIAALPTQKAYKQDTANGWIRAPFYVGVMSLHDTLKDEQHYLNAMMDIAEQCHWELANRKYPPGGTTVPSSWSTTQAALDAGILQPGWPFLRHADDLAMGQLYCELYFIKRDSHMIESLQKRADQLMSRPQPGRDEWWWCDSLFMAPPTLARLSAATGDRKYLDYMDKQWWDATDLLLDKHEHLYFRDRSYFKKAEKNGQKVFWSRGNGWVVAGIVRILQYMPEDYPSRPKYIALLKEMSERIVTLQQPDGFWRASLLDPASYPGGETSGTGFFCYAMAWAINHNLLPRDQYLPAAQNAWRALKSAEQPDGKVGWIQPVGASPAALKADDTAQYGVGAFLLAGTEVLKLDARAPQ